MLRLLTVKPQATEDAATVKHQAAQAEEDRAAAALDVAVRAQVRDMLGALENLHVTIDEAILAFKIP